VIPVIVARWPLAVGDAEAAVVAQEQHLVSRGVRFAGRGEGVGAEEAGRGHVVAGGAVEGVDVGLGECHHQRGAGSGLGGGPPVGDEGVSGRLGGVGEGDALPVSVDGDRGGDIAVTYLGERLSFPGVVLTAVLGELDGRGAPGELGEGAASVDLGQLSGVADEHNPGVVPLRGGEEGGEFAGADHAGFVDDEDPADRQDRAEGLAGSGQVDEDLVDGRGRDPGAGLESLGRSGGEGGAHDRDVGLVPSSAGGVEGEGLAGPGPADHDRDRLRGGGDGADHGLLLGRQGRPGVQGGVDGLGRAGPLRQRRGAGGEVEDRLFRGEEVGGGVGRAGERVVDAGGDESVVISDPGDGPVDVVQVSAAGGVGGDGLDEVAAVEGGAMLGQPGRSGEPAGQVVEAVLGERDGVRIGVVVAGRCQGRDPRRDPVHIVAGEADVAGAVPPDGLLLGRLQRVGFRRPGDQRGGLRGRGR
jgi:hypothetical protein